MPLTDIQRDVVVVLKQFRTPHTYVAGGAVLNHNWLRLSDDLDIFHDGRDALPGDIADELKALAENGFACEMVHSDNWTVEIIARKYGFETKIQWFSDLETSQRFFAAQADEQFGFRLHQADAAVNKVLCASRRNTAPRDAVDLMTIAQDYAPLGPLVWAASAKENMGQRKSPRELLDAINQIVFGYGEEEIQAVRMDGPKVSRADIRDILKPALKAAARYCEEVAPVTYDSHLFIDQNETPVEARSVDIESGRYMARAIMRLEPVPSISD
ncbi:MAG: hypothetical protein RJS98_03165 [Rhodospirillaceae bacterium]